MSGNFKHLHFQTEKVPGRRFFDQKNLASTGSISNSKPKLRKKSGSEIIGAVSG